MSPVTRQLLCSAGIGGGMDVLHLYCGYGDLTFEVADRVGPSGSVMGIDPSAEAVASAKAHAARHGYHNVEFRVAEIDRFSRSTLFDAVVCRHVLVGQRDPAAFLRSAARFLRKRGVIAVHEMDMSRGIRSVPPLPDLRPVNDVIRTALERNGVVSDAGRRLVDLFDEADIPLPMLFAQSVVASGLDGSTFSMIASTMRSLAQHLTEDEVASVDVDTLERRLRCSALRLRSQVEFMAQVCAWARVG